MDQQGESGRDLEIENEVTDVAGNVPEVEIGSTENVAVIVIVIETGIANENVTIQSHIHVKDLAAERENANGIESTENVAEKKAQLVKQ